MRSKNQNPIPLGKKLIKIYYRETILSIELDMCFEKHLVKILSCDEVDATKKLKFAGDCICVYAKKVHENR